LKWKFKGDVKFGELSIEEQAEMKHLVCYRLDSKILDLSSKGVGDVYLKNGRELFIRRLERIADDECPEALLHAVSEFYDSAYRNESLEVPIKKRYQYNVNTPLDLFYLALEKLLGFERIIKDSKKSKNKKAKNKKSNNFKREFKYQLVIEVNSDDDRGVAFPDLVYVGNDPEKCKKFKRSRGRKAWKSLTPLAKDSYRRHILAQYDSSMKQIFHSGELDRYVVRGRELFLKRLNKISPDENPNDILDAVIKFYKQWFRLDEKLDNGNHNLFSFDYLLNKDSPKSVGSDSDSDIEDDASEDVDLVEDLDQYINGGNELPEDDSDEEDDAKENDEALSRLIDEDDFDVALED